MKFPSGPAWPPAGSGGWSVGQRPAAGCPDRGGGRELPFTQGAGIPHDLRRHPGDRRRPGFGGGDAFDDSVDLRKILLRIAAFFRDESCWPMRSLPGRHGAAGGALSRLFGGHSQGVGQAPVQLAEIVQVMSDASICGLGHTASSAIQSALARWGEFSGPSQGSNPSRLAGRTPRCRRDSVPVRRTQDDCNQCHDKKKPAIPESSSPNPSAPSLTVPVPPGPIRRRRPPPQD